MAGRFIVLEGPDGSGTTTHAKLLADRFVAEGQKVIHTCEPTNGPIGKFIREHLKDRSMPPDALQLLFTADRAWHIEHDILLGLEENQTIVCDRYSLSTIVYAAALELDPQYFVEINKMFIQPDVQILLMPPFDVGMSRVKERGTQDILEEDSFQKHVYEQYKIWGSDYYLPTVDSSKSIEEVAEHIYQIAISPPNNVLL